MGNNGKSKTVKSPCMVTRRDVTNGGSLPRPKPTESITKQPNPLPSVVKK